MSVTVKKLGPRRWICKGPQGHKGEGSTREIAMAEYAQRVAK